MDEIIEFSELEDYIHQPVKYYSAGMYSRLAFAVSTSLEPDILIIDEVLGAGDAAFTSKCAERMKHLTQDTGATVLFVSHSMESVLEICNRAILLERGEITHQGTALESPRSITKRSAMKRSCEPGQGIPHQPKEHAEHRPGGRSHTSPGHAFGM